MCKLHLSRQLSSQDNSPLKTTLVRTYPLCLCSSDGSLSNQLPRRFFFFFFFFFFSFFFLFFFFFFFFLFFSFFCFFSLDYPMYGRKCAIYP